MNRLTDNKKTSYILLSEFTFNEVRSKIAVTLKVAVKDLPKGLDQMVRAHKYSCFCIFVCIYMYHIYI
jgi:hypothetical protein